MHHGGNLQAAIDAPMFNTSHLVASFHPRQLEPLSLLIEGRFDKAVLDDLAQRGHQLVDQDSWALDRMGAVARGRNGVMRAAATPALHAGLRRGTMKPGARCFAGCRTLRAQLTQRNCSAHRYGSMLTPAGAWDTSNGL